MPLNDLDIAFINEPTGADKTLTPGDDLRPEIKKKLGDYLSGLTKDGKNGNKYSLKGDVQETTLQDQNGNPLPIQTGGAGAENSFTTPSSDPHLEQVSNSGLFEPSIKEYFTKGQHGHTVLKEIVGNGLDSSGLVQRDTTEDNKILKRVSRILKSNRFNPDGETPFVPRSTGANVIDDRPIGKVQRKFGVYDSGDGDITFANLRKVGMSLMLKATSEIGSDADPESSGLAAAAIAVPGAAQLGLTKINPADMYASNAFAGNIFSREDIIVMTREDLAVNGSNGNLNSFLEPFGGFQPLGMSVLATALVLAIKILVEGILLLLSPLNSNPDEKSDAGFGPFTLGKFKQKIVSSDPLDGLISTPDFGIVSVNNDFQECVSKGIDIFFGFDGTSFNRVLESPGFYAIFVRSIIKSGNQIAKSITDAASSGNFFEGAQAVIGIIDTVKSSKIIGFVNVLASIGDRAVEVEKAGFDLDSLPTKISSIDELPDGPSTRVSKSRSKDKLDLSWRNTSVSSMYLLPEHIAKLELDLVNKNNKPASAIQALNFQNGINGRINSEDVRALEKELDAEYVPFYFHDIRTNEIISFHAFLSNITDSFSAQYENSDVYGRIDSVMIYKGTKRSIVLEFTSISTNPTDFDEMWLKINKLVTMVYPQWSAGRQIKFENDKFIQPFSQIPTSSPLIRLRLGDVLKTNYSRFALARLFGFGTENFDLSAQTLENAIDKNFGEKMKEVKKRMLTDPGASAGGILGSADAGYKKGEKAILNKGVKPYKAVKNTITDPLEDKKKDLNLINSIQVRVVSDPIFGTPTGDLKMQTFYKIELVKPKKGFEGEYIVGFNNLVPIADEILRIAQNRSEEEGIDSGTITASEEFFSPDQNAIVKSFESAAGKGLAGFITDINFNMQDARWDTDRYGARAPQWLKISINFSPIHDIPPGIDSRGFNRAPIYNVGQIMNKISAEPYVDDEGEDSFNEERSKAMYGKTSNTKIGF